MKSIAPNSLSSANEQLAEIVEEIATKLQAGEDCDIEQYACLYPEHADRLRDWMTVISAMADLGHSLTVGAASRAALDAKDGSPRLGESTPGILGDFRILRELGRGGMGVVYEAEQISLGRRVALKVLPFAAMLDRQQLARFKNEARAAATLDHPNIVAIHSVGVDRGVHYYAMQLIEGRSLAEIIAAMKPGRPPSVEDATLSHPLPPGEGRSLGEPGEGALPHQEPMLGDTAKAALPTVRTSGSAAFSTLPPFDSRDYFQAVARLGIQAAEALDHAHQSGILHRDIKPANLLLDDAGKLWITDFGLARIEADAGLTMTGDLMGTLRYMSPEQALAKRVVVDHRSDIYSLGATLYELLTLQPVFAGDDRHSLLRQISFDEPKALRKVNQRIPAELETIILKSLGKNPSERYATARDLADDLRCFIEHKPIQAKPPTRRDRAVKWSRRHPAVVYSGIAILLVTTIASITSVALIANAYQREMVERQQADQIASILINLFSSPTPDRDGRGITIAEMLDRSAEHIKNESTLDPRVKAKVLATIGETYGGLGLYRDAIPLLEQSRDLLTSALGPNDPDTLSAMHRLVNAYGAGPTAKAVSLAEDALRICQSTFGPDATYTLTAMSDLAATYSSVGREDEAIQLLKTTIELKTAKFGLNHPDTVASIDDLSTTYANAGRVDEQLQLAEESLKLNRARFGPRNPSTIGSMNNVALAYRAAGRWDEALNLAVRVVALKKEILGADNSDTLSSMNNLILIYREAGKLDDALRLGKETFALTRARFALGGNYILLNTTRNLALVYADLGMKDEALRLGEEALQIAKSQLSPDHSSTLDAMSDLAAVYRIVGRRDDGIKLLEEVRTLTAAKHGVDHPRTLDAMNSLAVGYSTAGRASEALQLYEETLQLRQTKQGSDHPRTLLAMHNLAEEYRRAGKTKEALELAQQTLRLRRTKLSPGHPSIVKSLKLLVLILEKLGNFAEAETAAREIIRLKPDDASSHAGLGRILARQKKFAEAESAFGEAIRLKPDFVEAHVDLGSVLDEAGRTADAEDAYRTAIRLDPSFAAAYRELGTLLDRQKKYVESEELYRKALELNPDDEHSQAKLGNTLRSQRKFAEAEQAYRNSIKIQTADALVHFNLGTVLSLQGKHAEAVDAYRESLRINPNYTNAWYNLGDALWRQDKFHDAANAFREAIRLKPDFGVAIRRLGELLANSTDLQLRNPAEAVKLAQQAVELEPQSSQAWQLLGWSQYRAGNWDASIEALEKSCSLQKLPASGDAGQWLFLAMAHWQLDRTEEARKWYGRATDWLDKNERHSSDLDRFRTEAAALIKLPTDEPMHDR